MVETVEKVRVMDNTNIGLLGVLEGEKRMAENFPEFLMKNQQIPIRIIKETKLDT